ncbi:unnamed protein product, partial [Aphanomyces euteiches]
CRLPRHPRRIQWRVHHDKRVEEVEELPQTRENGVEGRGRGAHATSRGKREIQVAVELGRDGGASNVWCGRFVCASVGCSVCTVCGRVACAALGRCLCASQVGRR